jgi:hypothetical protein
MSEIPVASPRNRRIALLVGVLAVVAASIGTAAWYELTKTDVVAYVHVGRYEPLLPSTEPPETLEKYQALKRSVVENIRSKSLLIRALRDPKVSNLPLVTELADPVGWLQDHLSAEYPGDAELLEIKLRGHDPEDAVKLVDAVVDAFFKEVVEKGIGERRRKEEKLRELVEEKSQQMVRELKEVQRMSEALGIADPPAATAQNQVLQIQLNTLTNSIFGLRSQLSNLEVEAEEAVHKDERLARLEDQISNLDEAIENAKDRLPGKEDIRVQTLLKQRARLHDRIQARRDTLKSIFEKRRASLKEQLTTQEAAAAEIQEKLKGINRDTAELENKRQKIKTLEGVVAKLSDELQRIGLEKYAPARIERIDQASAPGSGRKGARARDVGGFWSGR